MQEKNLSWLFLIENPSLEITVKHHSASPLLLKSDRCELQHNETNKMMCVASEDSDHPSEIGHLPSLIKVFAVRMKKAWVLSYPLSAQRRLWSDWVDAQADLSLRWAHMSFCWFCHAAAHFSNHIKLLCMIFIINTVTEDLLSKWYYLLMECFNCYFNWAGSWDYGTFHIGDQRRLRRACASAQSRQSLCCLHTWSMEVDRVRPGIWHIAPLDDCACTFEEWVYGGRKVP